MKRTLLLISAVLLSLTAMAQKVTLYMAGNQTYECEIAQLDSIVFSKEPIEIVVTAYDDENADGGQLFEKRGNDFYIDDIIYTVTADGNLEVGGNSSFSGVAFIISALKYKGKTMKVTRIGKYAFYGCSGLTAVTIGSGVTSIGWFAFDDCPNLTDVYCYAENVPETDSSAFMDFLIASATLHVPAGSVDAYKATEPWGYFGSIVAIE